MKHRIYCRVKLNVSVQDINSRICFVHINFSALVLYINLFTV